MQRKQVEIDGKKFTLGEVPAGAVEDCQDALASPELDDRAKSDAMRRLVAESLSRGGTPFTAEEVRATFSITEHGFLYREAMVVSGWRALPEGGVLGP